MYVADMTSTERREWAAHYRTLLRKGIDEDGRTLTSSQREQMRLDIQDLEGRR